MLIQEEKKWIIPIVNSYDPNDIKVNPIGVCDKHYILPSQKVQYIVRFQNTGNAKAIDITVKDTLSSFIDMTSIEVLFSSHKMQMNLLENHMSLKIGLKNNLHLQVGMMNLAILWNWRHGKRLIALKS